MLGFRLLAQMPKCPHSLSDGGVLLALPCLQYHMFFQPFLATPANSSLHEWQALPHKSAFECCCMKQQHCLLAMPAQSIRDDLHKGNCGAFEVCLHAVCGYRIQNSALL